MARPNLRIAVVALHTSPFGTPGSGDVGGMNVLIRATAERMAECGHQVEILTRRYAPDLPAVQQIAPRLTLRHIDAGPAQLRPKAEHEAFVDAFRAGLAELDDFDIVHSHHWLSGMAALPFARQRGVPHVQSFHSIAAPESTDLSEGERPESPGRLPGEAWLASNSDAIIAVSRAERATILDRLGAPREHVHVVLPGVDGALFHPRAGGADLAPYAAAAARIEPLKGIDLAIRAVAGIDPSIRPDLLIAGGPTGGFEWYLDELRHLSEVLGVADRVRFLGPLTRPALAELLAHATAVLIPSHSETYGLVALEAAASGVPVVAARSGGLREAVTERTGILPPSRDPQLWSAAMTTLLADPGYARRLGDAAHSFALTRTWERSTGETVAVYDGLLRRTATGDLDVTA